MVLDILRASIHPSWEPGRHRKEYRHFLSQASLVCYKWYLSLRPEIFAHLRLSSPADIRFLLEMSRNKGGGSVEVRHLELFDGIGWIDLERSCKLLAGKLPSLEVLSYNALHTLPKDIPPSAQHKNTPRTLSILPSRASLLHFSKVRTLSLLGVTFSSFSTLARVLGGLPSLQQVALHHVAWVHKESYSRPPSRRLMPSLTRLRYMLADNVLVVWPLISLWAPMLERRRIIIPDDPVADNTDTTLLALLVDICSKRTSTARMVFRYEDGPSLNGHDPLSNL